MKKALIGLLLIFVFGLSIVFYHDVKAFVDDDILGRISMGQILYQDNTLLSYNIESGTGVLDTNTIQEKLLQPNPDMQPTFIDVFYLQMRTLNYLQSSLAHRGVNDISGLFADNSYYNDYINWRNSFASNMTKSDFQETFSGGVSLKDLGIATDVIRGFSCKLQKLQVVNGIGSNDCVQPVNISFKKFSDKYEFYTIKELIQKINFIGNNFASIFDNYDSFAAVYLSNTDIIDVGALLNFIMYNANPDMYGDGLSQRKQNILALVNNLKYDETENKKTNLLGLYNFYYQLNIFSKGSNKASRIGQFAQNPNPSTGDVADLLGDLIIQDMDEMADLQDYQQTDCTIIANSLGDYMYTDDVSQVCDSTNEMGDLAGTGIQDIVRQGILDKLMGNRTLVYFNLKGQSADGIWPKAKFYINERPIKVAFANDGSSNQESEIVEINGDKTVVYEYTGTEPIQKIWVEFLNNGEIGEYGTSDYQDRNLYLSKVQINDEVVWEPGRIYTNGNLNTFAVFDCKEPVDDYNTYKRYRGCMQSNNYVVGDLNWQGIMKLYLHRGELSGYAFDIELKGTDHPEINENSMPWANIVLDFDGDGDFDYRTTCEYVEEGYKRCSLSNFNFPDVKKVGAEFVNDYNNPDEGQKDRNLYIKINYIQTNTNDYNISKRYRNINPSNYPYLTQNIEKNNYDVQYLYDNSNNFDFTYKCYPNMRNWQDDFGNYDHRIKCFDNNENNIKNLFSDEKDYWTIWWTGALVFDIPSTQ